MLGLISRYVNAIVATTYTYPSRSTANGLPPNIFLLGDAAHRIPPWGALGLNSGIADTQNLIWKLALALDHEREFGALLETYNVERRPIGITVAKHSLYNASHNANIVDDAVGIDPARSAKANWASIWTFLIDDGPEGDAARERVAKAKEQLDTEFSEQGIEIGYQCESAMHATDPGGQTTADTTFVGADYGGALAFGPGERVMADPNAEADARELGLPMPTGAYQPAIAIGAFLPHAWLQKRGSTQVSARISTIDLVVWGRFLLLTGSAGAKIWKEALAQSTSPLRPHIDLAVVALAATDDDKGAEYTAFDETWARFDPGDGAYLVRPDLIVAWRGKRQEELDQGLAAILATTLTSKITTSI